jgi:hypothetical protein
VLPRDDVLEFFRNRNCGESKSSVSPRKRPKGYVVCARKDDYAASLEPRKLYAVLPDAAAAKHSLIRVIDESGEDYL